MVRIGRGRLDWCFLSEASNVLADAADEVVTASSTNEDGQLSAGLENENE